MEPITGTLAGFDWAAATDIGRVRRENQDSWLVQKVPAGLLVAVADGMGGHPNGLWASRYALGRLATELAQAPEASEATLAAVARVINRDLRAEAMRIGTPGAGTTLVAAVLSRAGFTWLNVGDSRCYVLDPPLRQVTRDHNLAAEPGGHPRLANVLTRSIGPAEYVEADVCAEPIGRGVLLATDGVYGLVPLSALEAALTAPDLGQACRDLVDAANRAGGYDNATVVLVRPVAIG